MKDVMVLPRPFRGLVLLMYLTGEAARLSVTDQKKSPRDNPFSGNPLELFT